MNAVNQIEHNSSMAEKKLKDALRARKYRAENKERLKEIAKKAYLKNREKRLAWHRQPVQRAKANERSRRYYTDKNLYENYLRDWYKNNAGRQRALAKARYALNIEKKRADARKRQKENKVYRAMYEASRRAWKIRATPSWVNDAKLIAFYEQAKKLTESTGIIHHVDHIVPLRSKLVCGLHWEANLQVLVGAENISKSNRVWPDMS